MYSQSFSIKELYKCVWQTERRNLSLNQDTFGKLLQKEARNFLGTGTFPFAFKKEDKLCLNAYKSQGCRLCQDVVMRKLSQNIRKIYSIKQSDRNMIVKQIISLLNESPECFVVRMDVKSFYESVNVERILIKFRDAGRLSAQSLSLLDQIFANPEVTKRSGLPRGLSISALLSEFYMKYFDLQIKRMSGVYYYARFVDDIIVFCLSEDDCNTVWDEARKALGELGLRLNLTKSYKWKASVGKPIVYLGYSFVRMAESTEVRIAPKKIDKIKTKIVRALFIYRKENDNDILVRRIKYLTGNYKIRNTELRNIYAGIYYNYKLISCTDQLSELDNFLNKLLYGKKLTFIPDAIKAKLHKYSFSKGFEKRICHHFAYTEIKKIKSCWLCV